MVIDRLYGEFGSLWMGEADDAFTLESGLSALRGTLTSNEGLPITVLAFPQLDAIVVATAGDDATAKELMDGILATIRVLPTQPPVR